MYSFVHKTFPCLLEMVLIIKGYRAIGLPLYSDESKAMHYIYIKEHAEKIMRDSAEQKKKARILFVGNVDYKRNMSHEDIDQYLRILFFRFGDVVSVSVSSIDHLKNISSRFAHVTFAKKSALLAALNASNAEYLDAGREVASTFGLKRTVKSVEEIRSLHSFVNENPAELKEEVDEFMKEFEENELSEKQDAEKKSSEADNDGFMPVKSRSLFQFIFTFYSLIYIYFP